MKNSNYNIFEQWNNFHIGVNLLTGDKVVFLENEYNDYESTDANNLEIKNNTLFKNLKAAGFLIDDSIDEFNILLHRRNNDVFYNNNVFRLTILPTLECNFNCWYCYEKHPTSKMTDKTLKSLILYIDNIIKTKPMYKFQLDWFGGEPLLYFDEVIYPMSQIIKKMLSKSNIQFANTITTNGYLINNYIENLNEINLNDFQITLDGTRNVHNRIRHIKNNVGSYDMILNNINNLCSVVNDISVTLRINYTNETLNGLASIIDDIKDENKHKITIVMQRVWQTINKEEDHSGVLENQVESMRNKGIDVCSDRTRYNKGCICYADSVNHMVVNYDGKLFKCTARDFTNSKFSVGYIDDNGNPCLNNNYYKHFLKAPFDNESCRECLYVPICLGVCSQKFVELGGDFINDFCNKKNFSDTLSKELLDDLYEYIYSNLNNNE